MSFFALGRLKNHKVPHLHPNSTMFMPLDRLQLKIQGGFFNWSALKMTKYEEKLKYLNWSAISSRKVLSVNPQ